MRKSFLLSIVFLTILSALSLAKPTKIKAQAFGQCGGKCYGSWDCTPHSYCGGGVCNCFSGYLCDSGVCKDAYKICRSGSCQYVLGSGRNQCVDDCSCRCCDTDNGDEPWVRGTVSSPTAPDQQFGGSFRLEDRCSSSTTLTEYICQGFYSFTSISHNCNAYGAVCEDGRCVASAEPTTPASLETCNDSCQLRGYSSGTCRSWSVERASFCLSGETNLGPINCPRSERCCCSAATPTPTPTTPPPPPPATGQIAGYVWMDTNGDGIETGGEPKYNLASSSWVNCDPFCGQPAQQITAPNGNFNFTNVLPRNDHQVFLFSLPSGYLATTTNPLTNVSVLVGQTTNVKFGIRILPQPGWFQVQGGDVHTGGDIESSVPDDLNFMEGNPQGVVSFVGSADFGDGNAPNWRVQDSSINLTDFNYNYFYSLLGSPSTDNFNGSKIDTDGIYYSADDVGSLTGNWPNFRNRAIVLINGNLTINQEIHLKSANAFLAFIVKGTITVDGSVGTNRNGTTPSIEGIYFAQGFNTGTGADPGHAKLIVKGIFVAQSFSLQRDLEEDNKDTPAETFVFDPGLLVKMPKELKKSVMSWEEVAP